MQLPDITYFTRHCELFESDWECNGQAKPNRILQLLQDVATDHAEELGFGWNAMDNDGLLWVLSKIKVVFDKPLTRDNAVFDLYIWPLAPGKLFAERCFAAVSKGEQLFSATSLWNIISRNERKIVSATDTNKYYHGAYSDVHSATQADFLRIRYSDEFQHCYTKQVLRSDLDKNGHVNNTNYISYAIDVLNPAECVRAFEIVYHKELKLRDNVEVYSKRDDGSVQVVGMRNGEMCFSSVLYLQQ